MTSFTPGPKEGVAETVGKRVVLRQAGLLVAAGGLFFAPGIPETEAAFTTNFSGVGVTGGTYDQGNSTDGNYRVDYACNMSYTVVSGVNNKECSGGDFKGHNDGTPFFQAIFTESGTNKKFYHVIIGDKNKKGQARNEMVFEYFIEATTSIYTRDSEGPVSASYIDNSSDANAIYSMTNPYDGTQLKQGAGSGNPTRAIMNQVLYNDDGTVNTQFLKGIKGGAVNFNKVTGNMTVSGGVIDFNSKPIITQFANSAEMYNQFTIDMRDKTYQDGTPINFDQKITNITKLRQVAGSAAVAADQGDYDTTDAEFTAHFVNQASPYTVAGAYTYTDGSGTNKALGGGGTYNYDVAGTSFVETGFIPTGKDYTGFCEPSVNPDWRSGTNTLGGLLSCTNGGSTRKGEGSKGWD